MDLFKLVGKIAIENGEANKEIDDTTSKAEGASSKMGSAFKKIGLFVASAFAVDKIKDFGLGCINAASDAGAATAQFTQVFGKLESKASKSLKGIADTAGISENRMKGSYTKIAAFAKTTGMDTQSALGLTERAMIAVADSAAFYDRSLEDTTESLQSFLKGNFENDAALGLSCTETTRNAAANKLYGKSFKDLSESQKQLTLLQMVEDANKASGALGQAARESDTWTNVTGNLQQTWKDFQAILGKPILEMAIPIVKTLADKVSNLSQKVNGANNPINKFVGWVGKAKDKMVELGRYASDSFSPAIGKIKGSFDKVKEAVQPMVDKFKTYVTNGNLARDATNFLKGAIDVCAFAVNGIASGVEKVINGFISMKEWAEKNKTTLQVLGIIIGGLTTAIIAYNAAGIIKKALDIAETVQIYGLIAAESAHTVASTIAAGATTALGAAMTFLTSPITLIILGIAALVAGFVILWNKCDGFRNFFLKMWDVIKQKWSEVQPYFEALWEAVKVAFSIAADFLVARFKIAWEVIKLAWSVAVSYFKLIANNIKQVFSVVKTFLVGAFKTAWAGIKLVWSVVGGYFKAVWNTIKGVFAVVKAVLSGDFKGAWEAIKGIVGTWANYFRNIWNNIKNVFSSVKSWFSNTFSAAWSAVKGIWSNCTTFFSETVNKVKTTFSKVKDIITKPFKTALDKVKGFFDKLKLKFPKIKMPHFSLKGKFSLKDMTVPKLSVSWYKKAMDNAMILNSPTIFGYSAATGKYLGGGEAGSEVVAGSQTLMNMIQSAVSEQNSTLTYYIQKLIEILVTYFPQILESMDREIVLDTGATVGALAVPMDEALGKLSDRKDRGR